MIVNRKCPLLLMMAGKVTKYGIKISPTLMYHIIPCMRNANVINKYGDFGTLQYLWNG